MKELEPETAALWVAQETIQPYEYGNENTYYIDEFGVHYFCKNYPENYGPVAIKAFPGWVA